MATATGMNYDGCINYLAASACYGYCGYPGAAADYYGNPGAQVYYALYLSF